MGNTLDLEDKICEKIKKPQGFDLSYFISKSYFKDNGSQNQLIIQSVFKYFQIFSGPVNKISGWKSERLSESITTPATSINSFTQKLTYIHNSK